MNEDKGILVKPGRESGFKPGRNVMAGLIFGFLVLMTVTGLIAYVRARTIVTNNTIRYSLDLLSQTVANIQTKLAEFENISVRLFINNDFKKKISGYLAAQTLQEKAATKDDIKSYFMEYMITNPDIFGFMFISTSHPEDSIIMGKNGEAEFHDLIHRFKKTTTYRNIIRANGGIVWSASLKTGINHYLVLGRVIKEISTGEELGILAIIIDEERLDSLVNLNVYNKLNISTGSIENYSVIINNEGEIVSSPFKGDIGRNITQLMKNIQPLREILVYPSSNRDYGNETNQGSFITKVNHKETLATFKTIGSKIGVGGYSGWHLLSLTPTTGLYAELGQMMLAIFGLGIMAAAILGLLFLWRI